MSWKGLYPKILYSYIHHKEKKRILRLYLRKESTLIHQKWAISESIHVNFVDFQQNSYFKLLILDHGTYFNISIFETKKYTNIEDLSHLHKKS